MRHHGLGDGENAHIKSIWKKYLCLGPLCQKVYFGFGWWFSLKPYIQEHLFAENQWRIQDLKKGVTIFLVDFGHLKGFLKEFAEN